MITTHCRLQAAIMNRSTKFKSIEWIAFFLDEAHVVGNDSGSGTKIDDIDDRFIIDGGDRNDRNNQSDRNGDDTIVDDEYDDDNDDDNGVSIIDEKKEEKKGRKKGKQEENENRRKKVATCASDSKNDISIEKPDYSDTRV